MKRSKQKNIAETFGKGIKLDASTDWQKFLELFADSVPVLISYVDTDERYRFNNKLYEDWFGYSREEAYGKQVKDIRGIEAYYKLRPHLRKALKGKEVTYDNILHKKDGTDLYVSVKFVPHKNLEGHVEGVFVLVIDITERKLMEIKLKASEEKLNRFVEANIIGVIITDLDGRIYEANDIFLKMVGYTREDLKKGKVNWLKMTPIEYLFLSKKAEQEIMAKGAAAPFEKEYIRKDGSRVPVLIGDVLFDKAFRRTIAFILDMTKQHELQKRKDEFIALASHELKTPLTSLKLYAQMMGQQVKRSGDKPSEELFIKLDKQINNLNKLVRNLLDVSRLQLGKLQYIKTNFTIGVLVRDTVQELQKLTKSHIFIIKGKANEKIYADRDRITQVLSNLITNAVKYSPQAKEVIISLKKRETMIQIAIQDFGIGIEQDEQKKLFERYFQINQITQESLSGLGLGLYLSKEIVEEHKGEIWLESEKGKGSTFYFTLPLK